MNNSKAKNLDLFITFLRIGFFTFGGGLAMIPLIEEEIVKKKAYIKEEDFIDVIAMVQSLPGAVAINMAGAVGVRINGVMGAVAAYLGVVLPSFITIYLIARFFTNFMENPMVTYFFKGLKPAVVAMIFISAWRMKKVVLKDNFSRIIGVLSFAALVLFRLDPIMILLTSGGLGFVLLRGKIDDYNN